MFVYCTNNVSYSETNLHKTFQPYNTYWILWIVTSSNTCLTVIFYLFSSFTWVLSIAGYGCNKVLDNTDLEFVNIYFILILL